MELHESFNLWSQINTKACKRMSVVVLDRQNEIIEHVLVVIAMEAEAAPLLKMLNLTTIPSLSKSAPCIIHSGLYKGCTVSVVTNGKCSKHGVDNVGTVPAALSTFLAIHQLSPDLIINAGTAGGFNKKGASIGDAYICSHMKNHDRRIPIPGFTEYGTGCYTAFPSPNIIEALGVKSGVVSTGNSLDHTDMDDALMLANDASVKDMEAAAIAWAANLSNTPLIALKVVTDIVDGDRPTETEFFENLATAAASLQVMVPKVIEFVVGKSLHML